MHPSLLCAQSKLLLNELTHRINNELASAMSMVSLVASRSTQVEAKVALAKVMDRLESYSLVHRALQMPEQPRETDASAYLRRLCLAISQSKLDGTNVRLVLVDSPLHLRAEQCWLLGMIVNELITNAVRHAFGEAGGELRVEIVASEQMVECRISDNGTARGEIRPGHGLRICAGAVNSPRWRIRSSFWPERLRRHSDFPPQTRRDCMMHSSLSTWPY